MDSHFSKFLSIKLLDTYCTYPATPTHQRTSRQRPQPTFVDIGGSPPVAIAEENSRYSEDQSIKSVGLGKVRLSAVRTGRLYKGVESPFTPAREK